MIELLRQAKQAILNTMVNGIEDKSLTTNEVSDLCWGLSEISKPHVLDSVKSITRAEAARAENAAKKKATQFPEMVVPLSPDEKGILRKYVSRAIEQRTINAGDGDKVFDTMVAAANEAACYCLLCNTKRELIQSIVGRTPKKVSGLATELLTAFSQGNLDAKLDEVANRR